AEVFGCVVSGDKVIVRDPAAGRWGVFLTSPGAIRTSAFTFDALVGTASVARQIMEGPLVAGQMVRSGLTLKAGSPPPLSAFEPSTVVTSVCAATAPGRVF